MGARCAKTSKAVTSHKTVTIVTTKNRIYKILTELGSKFFLHYTDSINSTQHCFAIPLFHN